MIYNDIYIYIFVCIYIYIDIVSGLAGPRALAAAVGRATPQIGQRGGSAEVAETSGGGGGDGWIVGWQPRNTTLEIWIKMVVERDPGREMQSKTNVRYE